MNMTTNAAIHCWVATYLVQLHTAQLVQTGGETAYIKVISHKQWSK